MTPATPTLLYIDDDEALARLVDRGLTRLGFKVVHAASGTQGLDRLAQGDIDVIALDQYMPGLDGLETLERIMAIPNAPPVVFVTRRAGFEHRRHRPEGRRRRLSGEGCPRRFHPPAAGRRRRRVAAGAPAKGPRRRRGRSARLTRPLCRARRRARGAVARGQPPRRQQFADHRLAVASAGQFEHAGGRQGGADQRHGTGRRGGPGSPPALHLARPEERGSEPVSRRLA